MKYKPCKKCKPVIQMKDVVIESLQKQLADAKKELEEKQSKLDLIYLHTEDFNASGIIGKIRNRWVLKRIEVLSKGDDL